MIKKLFFLLSLSCVISFSFTYPTCVLAGKADSKNSSSTEVHATTDTNSLSTDSEDDPNKQGGKSSSKNDDDSPNKKYSPIPLIPSAINKNTKEIPSGVTFEQKSNCWYVNNVSEKKITVKPQQRQSVYIKGCQDSTITIPSPKFTHLEMEDCKNVKVRFKTVITVVEANKCENITLTCTSGTVYTVQTDQTNGCKIFLAKEIADKVIIIHQLCTEQSLYSIGESNKQFSIPSSMPKDYNSDEDFFTYLNVLKDKGRTNQPQFLSRMEKGELTTKNVKEYKDDNGYIILPENNIKPEDMPAELLEMLIADAMNNLGKNPGDQDDEFQNQNNNENYFSNMLT